MNSRAMWTYSSTSEVHLQRFMNAVRPPDENNKWVKMFRRNAVESVEVKRNVGTENSSDVVVIPDSDPNNIEIEIDKEVISKNRNCADVSSELEHETTLIDNLETDLQEKFTDICKTLLESPHLFQKISEKITANCIEKLIFYILRQSNLDPEFLEYFYKDFFPVFLKREYSLTILEVLVNAYKSHSHYFLKHVLMAMVKDMEISNKALLSFVDTLDEENRLLFLTKILEEELSKQEFIHNLFTIFTLYKNTKQNHYIQKQIEIRLIENYNHCSKENTFGKLLLAFLQNQKKIGKLNDSENLKKCVESHLTPFKKPCLNAFKHLYES